MNMRLTRDQTFQVVLNLRTPIGKGQAKVGTGIFIVKDDKSAYILTASHVANDCDTTSELVISDSSGNCQVFRLDQFCRQLNWTHHPVADLSVLPFDPDPAIVPVLSGRFFPADQLNISSITPSRDAYLTAVGFPHGLGAYGKFSPFTFRSHASSGTITLNRSDTNTPADFFTLENPSVGGYSGGPIFDLGYIIVGAMTTNTGPTICHGIMHGTI